MNGKIVRTIAWRIVVPVVVLGVAWHAQAQDAKAPYPSMAPIDQYLIADRNAEIALARSAAPESISRMPRSWSSDGMVTKPQSKGRTVSYVWWNDHGCPRSTPRNSGTPSCEVRSASIRQPREPFCHSLSSGLGWYWRAFQGPDHRRHQDVRQKRTAAPGAWRDVLHVVEGGVPGGRWRALGSPPDVLRSPHKR